MARKHKLHQPFESSTPNGRFAKICHDMMASPAWAALNLRQRGFYLEFKRKYTQKMSNGHLVSCNQNDISFTTNEGKTLYGDLRTFRSDMDALIEVGLLDLIASGWNTRSPNIYGFSDRWKHYGEEGYSVPESVKRKKRGKPPCKE